MHWYVVTPVICESRAQSCYHSNCSSTIPLYIGGMLSMTVGWDGTGCLVAAELAMEQINNRSDILQGYELRMASKDTQCAAKLGPRVLFHHIYNEPQKYAIFGPPCSPSALIVASASTYWNLITVIYSALSPVLSDRVKYPNVYRVNPIATALFNDVFIWMMQTYHWRRVGYVAFSVESILQVQNTFIEQAAAINATVVSEVVRDTAKNQVENLKREDVRIIMAYVFEGQARLIFCEAFKIGFYGPEILWVFPGWFKANWWLIEDIHVNCTADEINEVVYTTNILGMDVPVISPLEKLTVAGIVSGSLCYHETVFTVTERQGGLHLGMMFVSHIRTPVLLS
ncbi:putative gamma-aminobutyric acid type B receptor subunit 1 [Apostichopus japonicus]|uniref:Putative gamma-aminobutyric acid type B receptor subunit 1 n=1 Tax=Stichopus japonicus TaxID=307972 RepID=A0A2G8L9J1_STIJA|nr:putative gamma-aminobutyric acid type B receptor subunit 1 [Apostichopus japonicus]